MAGELLINVTPSETRVALIENGSLQEVHIEREARRGLVGNIYLGGTGKTPLSIEIFSILKNLNMNPVFIRKKYKNDLNGYKKPL